ncbi:MAG: reverse transcriptase family protein [Sedimenticola sp.]
MKRGLIVTLHKGGNKRKDDPNNYRAITLSSSILKLYERLILEKITSESDSSRLSNLQGGFQKGMGCIMTSFLLRESILYAKENHSKLYVCFLDVQKAFDTVWHDALFYKLDMMNVDSAIIRSIMDMYEGAECRVLHNGHSSDSFPVLQGTKQGGVISPFLYLVYIDQLMRKLASVGDGLVIYDQNCSCPTVADDMTLISFSKRGLDAMMGICFNYSRKWHYKYNASKSAVIVFNETKYDFCTRDRTWKLGTEIVHERTEYTHLGIVCEKEMGNSENATIAATRLRCTFFGLINSGIHQHGLHPITSKKIYELLVIPRGLYGCELWNDLNTNELLLLERSHRSCVKFLQGLPRRTNTDVCNSLIGTHSLESFIDRNKLRFFGQMCMLPGTKLVKIVFLNRLTSYCNDPSALRGFIPDIFRIIAKYGLDHILWSFIDSGVFPSKYAWKQTVHSHILEHESRNWFQRVQSSDHLSDFLLVHNSVSTFKLWSLSMADHTLLDQCRSAVYLQGRFFAEARVQYCRRCELCSDNIILHHLYECVYLKSEREKFWRELMLKCGQTVFRKFSALSIHEQIYVILCSDRNILNIADCQEKIVTLICLRYLHKVRLSIFQ